MNCECICHVKVETHILLSAFDITKRANKLREVHITIVPGGPIKVPAAPAPHSPPCHPHSHF